MYKLCFDIPSFILHEQTNIMILCHTFKMKQLLKVMTLNSFPGFVCLNYYHKLCWTHIYLSIGIIFHILRFKCWRNIKWHESGFRPLSCTHRPNWARRTSDSEMTLLSRHILTGFKLWRSEAAHATLGHGGSPQYWVLRVYGEETFMFLSNCRDRETNPEL